MSAPIQRPTAGWRVVRLLWAASRRRAEGRAQRQRDILGRRAKKGGEDLSLLARLGAIVVVCFVHATLGWFPAWFARNVAEVDTGRAVEIALSPSSWTLLQNLSARQEEYLARKQHLAANSKPTFEERRAVLEVERSRNDALAQLAHATQPAGKPTAAELAEHRRRVERQFFDHGAAGFVRRDASLASQLLRSRLEPMTIVPVAALLLLFWLAMVICQGEGLELDVQRRRHPMWEWLFAHPIQPAHAFYAELLAPFMANPVYPAVPLFLWVLLGNALDFGSGLIVALTAGLPIAVALSCLNKSIEIAALLRLGARTRGAVLGVVSWIGYVAMVVPLVMFRSEAVAPAFVRAAAWLSDWFPAWPVRALLVGWGAAPNVGQVVASWWALAVALAAAAWVVTRLATAQGLQPPSDAAAGVAGRVRLAAGTRLGAEPLRRKELLWLIRDKGAVVQIVLVPLTIAATQAFQFQGLYHAVSPKWNTWCGLAIVCGTYFLLVLGPRSLASEGPALWVALTWPRGLEELLKAKARLWSQLANLAVGLVLAAAVVMFPAAWWKILLVGCGWLFFSSTLALKSVSLVTPPSSSGEPEAPNASLRWIAMIGTLAFGTGVVTSTWHVAIIGIVFSSLVGVAMWQGLRARLPYLFDRWAEEPVPAPSLIHATVGVAMLAEFIGVLVALASAAGGPSSLWLARAIGYGVAGAIGCVIMQMFLEKRGVRLADVVRWSGAAPRFGLGHGLGLAAGLGAAMAGLATLYTSVLRHIPAAQDALQEIARSSHSFEGQMIWFALLAVVFAPLAEEYFFRGLLFRTLDRELGDWRALVLSALFFAIFHPPIAWIPVAGLGLTAAWLFRHTRHLAPCVVCHMTYNGILVLLGAAGR